MLASLDPRGSNLPVVHLHIGQVHVARDPTVVITVLGSCVAVTLHCPRLAAGAICHAQLPRPRENHGGHHLRFAETAVRHMVEELEALGARRSEIEAKVFGGAEVLGPAPTADRRFWWNVGKENVEAAQRTLAELGVRTLASDLGGERGRKIFFYPHLGEVLLKRVQKSYSTP